MAAPTEGDCDSHGSRDSSYILLLSLDFALLDFDGTLPAADVAIPGSDDVPLGYVSAARADWHVMRVGVLVERLSHSLGLFLGQDSEGGEDIRQGCFAPAALLRLAGHLDGGFALLWVQLDYHGVTRPIQCE